MPTIIITIRQKHVQAQTTSVHPLLLDLRRENALLLSQSKGQGSAWFPSEQICTNKYITCPIIHSVAEWQSGAFFFFFQSSFRAACGTHNHQKGNFKTDHSVTLIQWRIFKDFQTKLWVTYIILHDYSLQIVGKGDIRLSFESICMEMLLAGSLKKKQTNKKKGKKPTQNHRDDTAMSSMAPVYKGKGFGQSRFTPCTVVPSKHAKHPYTDTKKQPVFDKE